MRHARWFLFVGLVSLAAVNPYVRGDGNGYYAWLVSPVIDGDLDFRNQYARADPLFRERYLDSAGRPQPDVVTATGRLENQWTTGPALLWVPWFLAAHAAVLASRALGAAIPADGYAWPYRWSCAIGTAVYGWIGLWLARRIATLIGVGETAASVATLAVWAATPFVVYQCFLPFQVPALAAFSVALFLWWWLAHRPLVTVTSWMVLGLAAGLMTVVYYLNAIVLLAVPYAAYETWKARTWSWRCVPAFAAGALLPWVPHAIGKAIVYGTPWTTGYRDRFFWSDPHLWGTAWSSNHGLFLWTPLVLVGVAGLFWLAARRREAALLSLVFIVFYYVVASYQNWHGLSSFGNRFFVSLTVVIVVGIGAVVDRLWNSGTARRAGVLAVLMILALWNAGLAFQWGMRLIPNRGPVDVRLVAVQQVTVVPHEIGRFLRQFFTARSALSREVEREDHRWDPPQSKRSR